MQAIEEKSHGNLYDHEVGHDRDYIKKEPFSKYKFPEIPKQPHKFWTLEDEDRFLTWLEEGGYFKLYSPIDGSF